MFLQTRVRDWWLCFPFPGWQLVAAKFVANLLVTARILYTVLLSTALVWAIELLLHGGITWQLSPANVRLAWQILLMTVLGWPVGVAFTALTLVFATGLWRGGHLLYGFVLGWLGAMTGSTLMDGDISPLATMHTYQLVLLVVGWPVAALCLLVTSFGVRRLANARQGSSQADEKERLYTSGIPWFRGNASAALFALDFRRYMVFGRRVDPLVRRLAYAAMGVLALGAFAAAFWREPLVVLPMFWTDVSQVFLPMTVTQLLIGDLAKGYGQWWLAFPHSRERLLVAKGLAALGASWIYTAVGLVCIAIGFAVHALLFGLDGRVLQLSLEYLWRCALVCLVLNPTIVTLGYATSALYRGFRQILVIPAYVFRHQHVHQLLGKFREHDGGAGPRILAAPRTSGGDCPAAGVALPLRRGAEYSSVHDTSHPRHAEPGIVVIR
jgi:hypothetical protein